MKKIFYVFAASALLFSCGGEEETTTEGEGETSLIEDGDQEQDLLASTSMDPRTFGGDKHADQSFIDSNFPMADQTVDNILGSYVGSFGKNMINITLYKTENGYAEGYSVCAGNFRKIQGPFDLMQDDEYVFDMDEPGTDQYDGKFEFTLDASDEVVEGKWTPFKEEGNSMKKYTLKKKVYKYDNSVGRFPEASQRLLTEDDVMNLSEDELSEMRNEIYARHGYSFKNKDWRYHFEGLDWYVPMGIDIRDKLTEIETENIQLIYEFESYYQDYYDDYGR